MVNRNKQEMKNFLNWTIGTLLVAIVVVSVLVYVLNLSSVKALTEIWPTDVQVGLITFVFTLPVTFAAAYVVVRLGDRMNALAEHSDSREAYVICKDNYLKALEAINALAIEFYTIQGCVREKLATASNYQVAMASPSPELEEELSADYSQKIIGVDESGDIIEFEPARSPREDFINQLVKEITLPQPNYFKVR